MRSGLSQSTKIGPLENPGSDFHTTICNDTELSSEITFVDFKMDVG